MQENHPTQRRQKRLIKNEKVPEVKKGLFCYTKIMKVKNKFPRGIEVLGMSVIENAKGEILLVKSPKWYDKWVMPGGHVEPGENIEAAILREGKEETGLRLKLIKIIGWGEMIDSKEFHRTGHFIYFEGYCKTTTKEIKLDNRELTQYSWFKPAKILKMDIGTGNKKAIKDLLQFKRTFKS